MAQFGNEGMALSEYCSLFINVPEGSGTYFAFDPFKPIVLTVTYFCKLNKLTTMETSKKGGTDHVI